MPSKDRRCRIPCPRCGLSVQKVSLGRHLDTLVCKADAEATQMERKGMVHTYSGYIFEKAGIEVRRAFSGAQNLPISRGLHHRDFAPKWADAFVLVAKGVFSTPKNVEEIIEALKGGLQGCKEYLTKQIILGNVDSEEARRWVDEYGKRAES